MKTQIRTLAIALVITNGISLYARAEHSYTPKNGFVPNSETAISIAQAVWSPIYGDSQIESEKPFSAKLQNGIWLIQGHLPEGMKGGVAEAEISQKTGEILRVSHGE